MAYTTIDDGSAHFHTQLYTGNGSSGLSITNDANAGDFQADLLWISPRSNGDNNVIFDSTRGDAKQLKANGTDAEDTHSPARVTIESDGFDLDTTDTNYNGSSRTYVAWQWKANGGSTTTNDASATSVGTIDSVYQANTTAGFSIVTYTGTGSAATVALGLGVKPEWIVIKNRGKDEGWAVYHGANTSAPETDGLSLNSTNATNDDSDYWNDVAPTTTTFGVSGDDRSGGSYNFVAYVFNSVQGYSKFGSYTGTGDADEGPFIYTGFKPAWVMIKETGATGSWHIFDTKRIVDNPSDSILYADTNDAEQTSQTGNPIDILSNGFKCRGGGNDTNLDDGTYVYMAFAEHPFVSSKGVPCTAR